MKILLCNLSWMKRYSGVSRDDIPRHGGQYIRDHGFGHEAINFKPYRGSVYGFIQLRTGTINIKRLDVDATDRTDNVLVVWRARSSRGSVVVGWYRNATVFRKVQKAVRGRSFNHGSKKVSPTWIVKARSEDRFLVPPHQRTFTVPVSHKGFGSQTFVSFLDSGLPEVVTFRQNLARYIAAAESGRYPTPKLGRKPAIDQIRKLNIEKAGIAAATEYYSSQGYDVVSVEQDNLGYDLKAKHRKRTLLVEVKGTAHLTKGAMVNLSPNEYRASKSKKRHYRICVVTDALGTPEVNDFLWVANEGLWLDENTGRSLSVHEVISANMTFE